MATGLTLVQDSKKGGRTEVGVADETCVTCSGSHGVWKCERFKKMTHADRNKLSLAKKLCFYILKISALK